MKDRAQTDEKNLDTNRTNTRVLFDEDKLHD